MTRTQLLSLALQSAGLSCAGFIAEYVQRPVSHESVWGVAAGRVSSAPISAAIDRLIEKEQPRIEAAFASYRQAA